MVLHFQWVHVYEGEETPTIICILKVRSVYRKPCKLKELTLHLDQEASANVPLEKHKIDLMLYYYILLWSTAQPRHRSRAQSLLRPAWLRRKSLGGRKTRLPTANPSSITSHFSHFLEHSSHIQPHSLSQFIVSPPTTAVSVYSGGVCRTGRGLMSVETLSALQTWPSTALQSGSCSNLRPSTSVISCSHWNKYIILSRPPCCATPSPSILSSQGLQGILGGTAILWLSCGRRCTEDICQPE